MSDMSNDDHDHHDHLTDIEKRVSGLNATHRVWVLPILRALDSLRGQAPKRVVVARIGEMLRDRLSEEQWAYLRDKRIGWVRLELRYAGLLDGEHGTWRLTADGFRYLEAHRDDALPTDFRLPALLRNDLDEPPPPTEVVSATDFRAYEVPLLGVLAEGITERAEIAAALHERLATQLIDGDRREQVNGEMVWRHRMGWALSALGKNGEARNVGYGLWEITESGRARLERDRAGWRIERFQRSRSQVRKLVLADVAEPMRAESAATGSNVATVDEDGTDEASKEEVWTPDSWQRARERLGADLFDAVTTRLGLLHGPTPTTQPMARNLVFYGPPGTGKTHLATTIAEVLTGDPEPGPESRWRMVQFHPSYNYEDFVQGLKPDLELTQLRYRVAKGPFVQICEDAEQDPENYYVLVIDEINRGDPARIFGELLYALEYRGRPVDLALGDPLRVPSNLVVLGTMNSVDRSVALVDYALRRRFAFVRVAPDGAVITRVRGAAPAARLAARVLDGFNRWLAGEIDGEHVVGHSVFLQPQVPLDDAAALEHIWRFDVRPLLEEFFFGDAGRLAEAERHWRSLVAAAGDGTAAGDGHGGDAAAGADVTVAAARRGEPVPPA